MLGRLLDSNPGLLFHNLVLLPMRHHCSRRATTAPHEPPLLPGEPPLLPMSHHCSLFRSQYHYFNYPLGNTLASPVLPCCNPRCSMKLFTYVYAIIPWGLAAISTTETVCFYCRCGAVILKCFYYYPSVNILLVRCAYAVSFCEFIPFPLRICYFPPVNMLLSPDLYGKIPLSDLIKHLISYVWQAQRQDFPGGRPGELLSGRIWDGRQFYPTKFVKLYFTKYIKLYFTKVKTLCLLSRIWVKYIYIYI